MPAARVRSIEFLSPIEDLEPSGGNADVKVLLEDGTSASFVAATPDQPAAWMKKGKTDFSYGTPLLFARSLDQETVGEAVVAMAAEMSGYWLRYYNSLGGLPPAERASRRKERRKGARV